MEKVAAVLCRKPMLPALAGLCLLLTGFGDSAGWAQDGGGEQGGRSGRRRSFDPASYLQRLDANSNGAIEPSELSDRSRRFVEGLGFNPDETNSLEKIKAKISGDQASSGKSEGNSGSGSALGSPERKIVRKVPGFGTSTPTRTPVPNFTASQQPSSSELEGKYGNEILEQVDAAMQRYDKNGDGKIDQGEMGEGRWGQPEPKESDLDKDGNLSRAEMAERYYRRTRGSSSESSSSSRRSSGDRSESGDRVESSERGESRSRFSRDSSSRESRSDRNPDSERRDSGSEESRRDSESSAEEPRSGGGGGDRYRKYAEGLIQQYDTDKDGSLNKEELKNMKQRPENADLDNNGLISAGELTEALANGSMASGGGGASSSGNSSSSSSRSSRDKASSEKETKEAGEANGSSGSGGSGSSTRSGSSRSSGGKFSFNASDKNGDGKVQMHEFTDEWSDEKFEEFKTFDKNGDGVITNTEYRGDSGRDR
jgi:Ca2+-binding EF-hand superfamily protein